MITLRSIYDVKTFKAFQKYSLKGIFILAYICALILLGIGIAFLFTERKNYIVYFIGAVLFPIVLHVFYKIHEIDVINRNIYLRDTTMQIFTFNDEGFELEQISKIDTFRDKYTYKDIYSIIKYKRYYFIYINRVQAFVINNSDYVSGNEKELDELFKTHLGKKFIIKRSSKKRVESFNK